MKLSIKEMLKISDFYFDKKVLFLKKYQMYNVQGVPHLHKNH